MAEVITGRQTATVDDDVVVFLIGMRINRLRRVRSWLPAFRAMPQMLRELAADPSLGLLGVHSFWAGRTILAVQYWRSFEDLERFARSTDHEHLPAWQRVQPAGPRQRRRRDLPRDVPRRAGNGRVALRQHAAVRDGRRRRRRAGRGSGPVGGPPDGHDDSRRTGGRAVLSQYVDAAAVRGRPRQLRRPAAVAVA